MKSPCREKGAAYLGGEGYSSTQPSTHHPVPAPAAIRAPQNTGGGGKTGLPLEALQRDKHIPQDPKVKGQDSHLSR